MPARDSCLCSVCLGLQCALPSEGNERARNGNKQTYFLFHLGHPAICLVFFFRSAIRLPHKFSFLSGNDRLLRRYKLNRFRPPKEDAMTFENRRVLLKNKQKKGSNCCRLLSTRRGLVFARSTHNSLSPWMEGFST